MTPSALDNALHAAWKSTLARRGASPAILSPAGEILRTFADIDAESVELEALFADVPEQSVVAVQIGNNERWPALLLSLLRRRLVVLPLGRHMENRELDLALTTCQAAGLVTLAEGKLWVTRCATLCASARVWDEPVPHLLKLTSGTTSLPRAIRFRAGHMVADCENICETMGITDRDLNFGVIPFSHSYGFSNLVTPLLCRGVSLVASEDRMPRAILNDLARSGATVFPGMPVFFQNLAAMQHPPELAALRLCISAGSLLPPVVATSFTAAFGRKIHTFYGSSECGAIAYDASEDQHCEEGFVGQPMRGVEITTAGEPGGTIEVRSAAVGDDYFPHRDRSQLGNGRFIPGDLVHRSARGLRLVGRASEVINIAGRKLNPLEVEARLADFPGVRQVVVFGVPSDLRGEEAVACVVGESVEAPAVMRFCQGQLSGWQIPREVWIVPEIPTNDNGKISRRVLAERYLAHKGQSRRTKFENRSSSPESDPA